MLRREVVESVYRKARSVSGVMVYADSEIKDWGGWPDDVREIIRGWNKDKRLRFVGMDIIGRNPPQDSFKCPGCSRFINSSPSTSAKFDSTLICDDCLINLARRHGRRGRPETELEKAKRWQANSQKKLVKYRHNAIQERIYVAGLMSDADAAASRAHDAIHAEPFDRQAASDAIWDIHAYLRPYIEKTLRKV